MVFNAHAERVDEDAEKDPLLEDAVLHTVVQESLNITEHLADSPQAGGKAPWKEILLRN